MTREQKLALIVGFSLVLLVGVLISDHLSRARQAKIASIGANEAPTSALASKPTNDPLRELDAALRTPVNHAEPSAAGPQPSGGSAPQPVGEPLTLPNGPTLTAREPSATNGGSADDTPLREAVEKAGGTLVVDKDGLTNIIMPGAMPGAASMTHASLPEAMPRNSQTQTSPLYGTPNPAKNLATNEQFKLHSVQKGETLFQIASKYYGTGHVWRDLATFNGVTNKDGVVRVGTRLKIPSKDALMGRATPVETAGRPNPSPGTPTDRIIPARRQDMPVIKPEIRLATYTVKKGETLGEISKKVLGTSKRWQELAEFNKLDDEDAIIAGTILKLPPMRG